MTFGQVKTLNNATKACANFTGKKAQETLVWHASETVVTATAGTAVGAVALVTQDERLKHVAKEAFDDCGKAATKLGKGTLATGNGILNGVPGVGHVKGVVHDILGDEEGARQAYFSANRTSGVVGGALVGSLGGPVGAISGAIAGGAAMDGVHTGYASLKDGEYKPQGQIAGWTQVVQAKSSEEVVGGIVDGMITPVLDGVTGMTVYKAGGAKLQGKKLEAKANQLLEKAENARGVAPDGQVLKMYDAAMDMNKKAMKLQGKVRVVETLKGPVEVTVNSVETYVVGQPIPESKTTEETKSEDEDEHDKKKVLLNVFYVNARSINNSRANMSKVQYVKRQIGTVKPDIVAIVETWLTPTKTDEEVKSTLGLNGYNLFRRDRTDKNSKGKIRRGGGMILAIRNNIDAYFDDFYKDQFMAVSFKHTFNCSECSGSNEKSFLFGLLYRRKQPYTSGQTRDEFNEDSDTLWSIHVTPFLASVPFKSGTVLVGDFNFDIKVEIPNVDDLPWGVPISSAARIAACMPIYQGFKKFISSSYERGLFENIESSGMDQLVEDATHTDGNILDLIFSTPGFVKDITNRGNISVNSIRQDHCILTFKLLLGYDCDKI